MTRGRGYDPPSHRQSRRGEIIIIVLEKASSIAIRIHIHIHIHACTLLTASDRPGILASR